MRVTGSIVVAVSVLTTTSAWAATELAVVSGAALFHDAGANGPRGSTGALDPLTNSGFDARSAADGDEPFAVDSASLTSPGEPGPASERNPFSWTLLLIAFAGLTAVFARRKTGGRGLIAGG